MTNLHERYEIRKSLIEDDLGEVFECADRLENRAVAMRKVRPGVVLENELQAQILLQMRAVMGWKHLHVIPVADVGLIDGVPFYTTPLVVVGSLATQKSKGKVYKMIARLVAQVAEGLHAGHQHGVVHGALTPQSIWIGEQKQPVLADFGIAKALSSGRWAENSPVRSYLAPEILQGGAPTVAGDVYSLGVILYELLTGLLPFQDAKSAEKPAQSESTLPTSPRKLDRSVPRDLSNICMHCLEIDPAARYQTGGRLAADLTSWSRRRPLSIHRRSVFKSLRSWSVKEPLRAGILATGLVVLVFAAVFSSISLFQVKTAREHAENSAAELQSNVVDISLGWARNSRQSTAAGHTFDVLKALQTATKVAVTPEIRSEAAAVLSQADLRVEKTWKIRPAENPLPVLFSPDLQLTFRATRDGAYEIISTADQKKLGRIAGSRNDPVTATAPLMSYGHLFATRSASGAIRVWESASPGGMLFELPGKPVAGNDPWALINFAVNPAGILAVGQEDGRIAFYNPILSGKTDYISSGAKIRQIDFNSGGNQLAIVREGLDGVEIIDPEAPTKPALHLPHSSPVRVIGWRADSRQIALAGDDGNIAVWSLPDARLIARLAGPANPTQLLFTNRGTHLIGTNRDPSIYIWNIVGGYEECRLPGFGGEPVLRLSADDSKLLATNNAELGVEISLHLPQICTDVAPLLTNDSPGPGNALDFSQDNKLLAVATQRVIQFRDPVNGDLLATLGGSADHAENPSWSLSFGRFGETIYTQSAASGLQRRLYQLQEGRLTFGDAEQILKPSGLTLVSLSPDGNQFAFVDGKTNQTQLLTIATEKLHASLRFDDALGVTLDPTGEFMALTASSESGLASGKNPTVFAISTLQKIREIDTGPGGTASWSPNGLWFVANGEKGCQVTSTTDWTSRPRLTREAEAGGRFPVWSPDGRFLAISVDNAIQLYAVPEMKHVLDLGLSGPPARLPRAKFSRDSRHLAAVDTNGALKIWDIAALEEALRSRGLGW